MRLSVCTISFRHQLISLGQIAQWAKTHTFTGIELWGVHAKNLRDFPQYNRHWLQAQNLNISMVSDYLPLCGNASTAMHKTQQLCELATFWGTNKIRTFAGDQASSAINQDERQTWTKRLKKLCHIAAAQGIYLVVETHPLTLADTLDSTLRLLDEVNHSHLKINFDVIHFWEAGDDPQQAFNKLAPHIVHMHFKNISERKLLKNFKPASVYSPAGSREGMVSVFEGAFDFRHFLHFLMHQPLLSWQNLDVSLEWFGENILNTLNSDKNTIETLQHQYTTSYKLTNKQDAFVI